MTLQVRSQIRTERFVRPGDLRRRIPDPPLGRLQMTFARTVPVTSARLGTVLVIVPAQGVAHLGLQAFLDDQPRRQPHQFTLRVDHAGAPFDQVVQGFTRALASG